jgi:hypothetical protein
VTKLTRIEWSFVRTLFGRPRRFSSAFVRTERAKLARYREDVRSLRRMQSAGTSSAPRLEAELGLHGTVQMAVGQRVTAFHPKERHLFTGTVLTPDGDHYRIQFDRPKHGVQQVKDIQLMPLLDGSRGIDFTSPHGAGQVDAPGQHDGDGDEGVRRAPVPTASSLVRAEPKELQLLAYILRLLLRKRLLMDENKAVCTEAERDLMRVGKAIAATVGAGTSELHISPVELAPPPVRVEVTAAQQRVFGQVPTPPALPPTGALLVQLRATAPLEAEQLERRIAVWKQEVEWLQEELRGTTRALDTALAALRPTAQRFSLALGAAAPEPQSRGLGVAFCAELREIATERAAAILSAVIAERTDGAPPPSPRIREAMASVVSLLLQMQSWAVAPVSPAECRFGLMVALKKLTPTCEANRPKFNDVMATAQQLQSILCGVAIPGLPGANFGHHAPSSSRS